MGGTGAPGATQQQTNPAGFAGSRAATAAGQAPQIPSDFSSWLASVPGWAENQGGAPLSASPLVSNPTAAAANANPTAAATGFTHVPYQAPVSMTPIGAPAPPPPAADAAGPAKLKKPYDPVFKALPTRMSGDTNPELMWQIVQNGQVMRPGEYLPEGGIEMLGPYAQRVRDYEAWYRQSGGV